MANKTFTGYLRGPLGGYSDAKRIRFTHISTTGEVLAGSEKIFEVDSTGYYNISIEYGTVVIQSKDAISRDWYNHGKVTINSSTTATTLPSLLLATTPVTDDTIIQLEALLADAEAAQQAAEDAQTAAETAAAEAESSAVAFYTSNPANIDWHVKLPFKSSKVTDALYGSLTATRASSAYTIDVSGNLKTHATNEIAAGQKGVDIFESVTTQQAIDSSLNTPTVYNGTRTITSNLAPDLTTYWIELVPSSGQTAYIPLKSGTTVTSGTYITTSVFVKKYTGRVRLTHLYRASIADSSGTRFTFDSSDGSYTITQTDGVAFVVDCGGFYRIGLRTQYLDSNSATNAHYASQITAAANDETTAEIWGANVTNTSYMAPYIPTTTAAATRAADIVNIPAAGNFPASGQSFTFHCITRAFDSKSFSFLFSMGVASKYLSLGFTDSNNIYTNWHNSGVSTSSILKNMSNYNGQDVRIIFCYDGASFKVSLNGTVITNSVDASAATWSTASNLAIGMRYDNATVIKRPMRDVWFKAGALTDDQMIAMGGPQ